MKLHLKIFFVLAALLLSCVPTFANAAKIITQPANQVGVTAYWSFDNSTVSGSSVSDLSGNSHTLTLVNGASITTGYSGQALTLDGTNQYAWGLIGTLPTSVSLSMWVKANDVVTEQSILTEEGDGAPSSGYHFTLVGIYNGAFYAGFWNIGDIASGPINAGQWYNVVLYYDGVANTQSLYVDGVLQGTQSGTWSPPSNIYFLAGYQQSGCSFTSASGHCGDLAHYFNGQIDDLKGYNRALTSSDISSLQNQRTHVAPANTTTLSRGLVGYWPLDGGTTNWTSNTTADVSGQGNSATLVSAGGTVRPAAGKLGQALVLASGAYLLTNATNVAAPCTVSGWVNLQNSSNTSHGYPLMDSGQYSLRVQQVASSIVGETAYGVSDDTFSPSYTVPQNKWTFLTFVNAVGTATLYANGALQGTISNTYGCPRAFVGGNSGDWFQGGLDDVRVYSRALSANDIAQLYLLGNVGTNVGHSSSGSGTAAPLSTGLLGYWTFDGSQTSWLTNTTRDSSGQGNTGTLVNLGTSTAPTAGKLGQAFRFNGSTSYVNVGSSASLAPASFTASAWVYPTSYSNNFARVLQEGLGDTSGNGGYDLEFDAGDGGCGDKTVYGVIFNAQDATRFCPSGTMSLNQWHHVAFTYVGTTGKIYIDGALSGTASGVMTTASPLSFNIGRDTAGGSVFPGSIDDVRVYGRALSASEIYQLYQLGK